MPKQTLDQSFQFLLDLTAEKELAQLADDIIFDSDPEFEQYLDVLAGTNELSLDIETYGDIPGKAFEPEEGEIRLIQVYLKEVEKCLIWDLGRPKERKVEVLPNQQYNLTTAKCKGLDILIKKCESLDTVVNIQNAAFEGKWFYYKFGILIFNVWDSMIASQIIWAGCFKQLNTIYNNKPHSLASIAERLGFGVLDKENQTYDYALPLHNEQYNYAATDVRILPQIKEKLLGIVEEVDRKHLESYQKKIRSGHRLSRYEQLISRVRLKVVLDAEMVSIPSFISMRYWGFPLNVELLNAIENEYYVLAKEYEQNLNSFFKCLISSPKQILEAFDTKLGIRPSKFDTKAKQEKPSTDSEALEPYLEQFPILKEFLIWKSINYVLGRINEFKTMMRVHPITGWHVIQSSFFQNAKEGTGRSSSKYPNLQNVPKLSSDLEKLGLRNIRTAFTVPSDLSKKPIYNKASNDWDFSLLEGALDDDYSLLIIDLSGSHGQIACYVADAKSFFEGRRTGVKFHYYTAASILELQGYKYTPAELKKIHAEGKTEIKKGGKPSNSDYFLIADTYDLSKTAFYAFLNGSGPPTLRASFKTVGRDISLEKCALFLEALKFKSYPEIYNLQREINKIANSKNLTFTYGDKILAGGPQKQFKYFGEVRSIDGGRYLLNKTPSKYRESDPWSVNYTDAIAYNWLRPEGTCLKAASGLLVKDYYFKYPEWDSKLIENCHDELEVIVKKKYAKECAEHLHQTVNKVLTWCVKTYESEDHFAASILTNWSEK